MQQTYKNLEHFACDGLRTLLLAEKEIDKTTYENWAERFKVYYFHFLSCN